MPLIILGAILMILLGRRFGLSLWAAALVGGLLGFIGLQVAYPFFGDLALCFGSDKLKGLEWIRVMPILCRI